MLNNNFVNTYIYIYMYIINIIHNTNLIYVDSEICSTENICLYIYIYIYIYIKLVQIVAHKKGNYA